jgi:hypothetical protein
MLLIEIITYAESIMKKEKCTPCENAEVVLLVKGVFSKVNINLCSYNTIH